MLQQATAENTVILFTSQEKLETMPMQNLGDKQSIMVFSKVAYYSWQAVAILIYYILLLAHPIKRLELYHISKLELGEEVKVKGLYKVTFSFSLIWDKSIIPTMCRK